MRHHLLLWTTKLNEDVENYWGIYKNSVMNYLLKGTLGREWVLAQFTDQGEMCVNLTNHIQIYWLYHIVCSIIWTHILVLWFGQIICPHSLAISATLWLHSLGKRGWDHHCSIQFSYTGKRHFLYIDSQFGHLIYAYNLGP